MSNSISTTIPSLSFANVVVSSGETVSAAIDLRGTTLCGVLTPASFEGTALTFQASADGTNFFPVKNGDGTDFSVTVAANTYTKLDPADFAGIQNLKIVSGTVTTADRTLVASVRQVA